MFVANCKKRPAAFLQFSIFEHNFYNFDLQELTGRHEIKEVGDRAGQVLQNHGTRLSSQNGAKIRRGEKFQNGPFFTISGAFNAEFTAAIAAPNGLGSQRAGALVHGRPEVPAREAAVQRTARAGAVSGRRNGVLCFLFV